MAGKKYKMYIALSLFLYHWKIHNKAVHCDMLIMSFFVVLFLNTYKYSIMYILYVSVYTYIFVLFQQNNLTFNYYMSQIPKYGTVYRVIGVENVTAIVFYIYRK